MSSFTEAFPTVLLEAMSCRLPQIAFDVRVGPRNIILNDNTGYLVRDNDITTYANHIIRLMNDNIEWQRFSFNSIKGLKIFLWIMSLIDGSQFLKVKYRAGFNFKYMKNFISDIYHMFLTIVMIIPLHRFRIFVLRCFRMKIGKHCAICRNVDIRHRIGLKLGSIVQ